MYCSISKSKYNKQQQDGNNAAALEEIKMINANEIKALTIKIQELEEAADKQESKELMNFYGWMKDFKPSAYLKGLRREAGKLHSKIEKMAKKADAKEWDAMIKAQNICPEIYDHAAMTEY